MSTWVIATRNRHKVAEIQAVLGRTFRYRTPAELPDSPEVEEDGRTFAENARKKAEVLAAWLAGFPEWADPSGLWVLADDSGLEVDALDGAPGVHSARFATLDQAEAGNAPDTDNNAKLLRLLANTPAPLRTARFRCSIAVCPAGPQLGSSPTRLFEGACEGRILEAPRGRAGFGYDPLFLPLGETRTFAELGEEKKNRISHRARALAALAAWWRSNAPDTTASSA